MTDELIWIGLNFGSSMSKAYLIIIFFCPAWTILIFYDVYLYISSRKYIFYVLWLRKRFYLNSEENFQVSNFIRKCARILRWSFLSFLVGEFCYKKCSTLTEARLKVFPDHSSSWNVPLFTDFTSKIQRVPKASKKYSVWVFHGIYHIV